MQPLRTEKSQQAECDFIDKFRPLISRESPLPMDVDAVRAAVVAAGLPLVLKDLNNL